MTCSIGPTSDANIAPDTVEGQIVQLPAQSNFIFGVILAIVNILGIFGFIVSGIILLWLFRSTGAASVEAIERHPLKTLLIGLLVLIGAPLLVVFLAVSLVGLPLAALLFGMLLLALVFGPVPAVTAAGDTVLRRKGGLFGGFVLGAVFWRLGIWLIPLVGVFLYLVALVWGCGWLGAWVRGGYGRAGRWTAKHSRAALIVKDDPIPEGWGVPPGPEEKRRDLPTIGQIPRRVLPLRGRCRRQAAGEGSDGSATHERPSRFRRQATEEVKPQPRPNRGFEAAEGDGGGEASANSRFGVRSSRTQAGDRRLGSSPSVVHARRQPTTA